MGQGVENTTAFRQWMNRPLGIFASFDDNWLSCSFVNRWESFLTEYSQVPVLELSETSKSTSELLEEVFKPPTLRVSSLFNEGSQLHRTCGAFGGVYVFLSSNLCIFQCLLINQLPMFLTEHAHTFQVWVIDSSSDVFCHH